VLTHNQQLKLDLRSNDRSHADPSTDSDSHNEEPLNLTNLPFDIICIILSSLKGEDRVCLALACQSTCSSVIAASSTPSPNPSTKPVYRYSPLNWPETTSKHELIYRLGEGWFDRSKWRYCAACGAIRSLNPKYWDTKLGLNWSTELANAISSRELPAMWNLLKPRKRWRAIVQRWCSAEQYQRAREHLQWVMSFEGDMPVAFDSGNRHCACHSFNNSICTTLPGDANVPGRPSSAEKRAAVMATWCPGCACLDIGHGGRMTSPGHFYQRWWIQNRVGFALGVWAVEWWRDLSVPRGWGGCWVPWRRANWTFTAAEVVQGRLRTVQVTLPWRR
jgi:hypothetical protein